MATMLSSLLPAPVHAEEVEHTSPNHTQNNATSRSLTSQSAASATSLAAKSAQLSLVSTNGGSSRIPAYGKRKGWMPKDKQDYGDGGAL